MKEQEIKPFNRHSELPWERGNTEERLPWDNDPHADRIAKVGSPSWSGFARVWTKTENMSTGEVTTSPEGEANVDFIIEAANTYYPSRLLIEKLVKSLTEVRRSCPSNYLNVDEANDCDSVLAEANAFLKP